MNKKIIDQLEKITSIIENSDTYQNYLFLKEKLEHHQEAKEYIEHIKQIQKQLVKMEFHKEPTAELENILKQKHQKLEEIPLYHEFLEVQTELNETFQMIKQRIETYLEQKTNSSMPNFH